MGNFARLQKNIERWALFDPEAAKALQQQNQELASANASAYHVEEASFPISEANSLSDAQTLIADLKLDALQLIYLYGVGLGEIYDVLKTWLEDEAHSLVLFESNLAQIAALLATERGDAIMHHPRVWLYFLDSDMQSVVKATEFFMGLKYATIASSHYQNLSPKLALNFKTKIEYCSNARIGFLAEYRSWGYGFFYNYLRNLFLWPRSFLSSTLFNRFQGVPAIICGAGPSLAKQGALLKELRDRALIFAGGTAMNGVNAFSLLPHVGVGIDPNMAQLSRIIMNLAYETPFFYRNRIYAHALKRVHGPLLHIPGSSGYRIAEYFERELGLASVDVSEGHNVINFSLSIAAAMGCYPIILVGVDLAYTGGDSYSSGVISHPIHHQKELFHTKNFDEELVLRNDIYGNPVTTLWKWVNESLWFGSVAAEHQEMQMINATEGGIGFHGVPNMSLRDVAAKFLNKPYDFDLMLFGEIQDAPMPPSVTSKNIILALENLSESLKRSVELLGSISAEEPHKSKESVSSAREQLEKEIAYTYVLADFKSAFENVKKKELWRLESDKTLMDLETWETKRVALKSQEQTLLAQVALSLSQQIEEVVSDQQRPPAPPVHSAPLGVSVAEGNYRFDAFGYEIHDVTCQIDYTEVFDRGDLIVVEKSMHPNGHIKMESHRKGEVLHGPSMFYSPAGLLLGRTWFVDGLRQGKALRCYATGALYAVLSFKNGVADGLQRYFYEDGSSRSEIPYQAGVLHGDLLLFHPGGRVERELHFNSGKREGKECIWSASGQLLIEAYFNQDLPVGTARAWHENGTLAYENKYDEPDFNVQIWNDQGVPISQEAATDYFKALASGMHRLTAEITTAFDQLNLAFRQLVPQEKREEMERTLLELRAEVDRLQDLNRQISVDSGLQPANQREEIWKTPSAQRHVESKVNAMAVHIKEEFVKLQTLLIDVMKKKNDPDAPRY